MAKKVSDENLLEALLVHGGASGAAAALQISRNAVYKRLQDPVFRAEYDSAQGVILSCAASAMAETLQDAVGTLVSVMKAPDSSSGVKVQAANALLTHCNRYIESANILRRLDALEENFKMNGDNEK